MALKVLPQAFTDDPDRLARSYDPLRNDSRSHDVLRRTNLPEKASAVESVQRRVTRDGSHYHGVHAQFAAPAYGIISQLGQGVIKSSRLSDRRWR